MTSLVWVRRKTHVCEVCGRVMDVDENYAGRCEDCGSDFCIRCKPKFGVCGICDKSSLFQAVKAMG